VLGLKSFEFKLFYNFSLEQAVPQNDFYRKLEKAVDLSWVRQRVTACYSDIGRPSIDPEVFIKIELIGYIEGIVSERKLMREIQDRLSLRRYIGYDIDEEVPEHSTLSRARDLLGKELFQEVFDHSVHLCQNAGMVGGIHISGDRSIVKANASLESLEPRIVHQTPEEFVNRVFAENPLQSGEHEQSDPIISLVDRPEYPTQLPVTPIASDPSVSVLLQIAPEAPLSGELARESTEDEAETHGQDVKGKDKPKSPTNRAHVSRTDPDATIVSRPGKPAIMGYAAEYWTDSRERVITHADAVTGSLPEEDTAMSAIHRQRQDMLLPVASVSLDRGYGLGRLYQQLDKANVVGFVPHRKFANIFGVSGLFTNKDFAYDADRSVFTCPAGKELTYSSLRVDWPRAYHLWSAKTSDCRDCGLRSKCKQDSGKKPKGALSIASESKEADSESTRRKSPRSLKRSIYQVFYDEMDERLAGTGARLASIARKTGPEPAFAEGKQWQGLDRAKYRGLDKFRGQVLLTAAAMNIKKYVKWTWRKTRGAGSVRAEKSAGNLRPCGPSLHSLDFAMSSC
jgi:transposase